MALRGFWANFFQGAQGTEIATLSRQETSSPRGLTTCQPSGARPFLSEITFLLSQVPFCPPSPLHPTDAGAFGWLHILDLSKEPGLLPEALCAGPGH